MRTFRSALLAAIALLPTVASAQMPPPDQNRPSPRFDRRDQTPSQADAPQPGPVARPDRPQGGWRGEGREFRGRDFDRRGDGERRGFAPGEPTPDRPDRWSPNGPGGQGGYSGRDRDRSPDRSERDDRPDLNDRGRWNGLDRWTDRNRWGNGRNLADRRGWDDRRGFSDWRNDRRYDWRGWRDRNRSLFRGPRYVAPRGYAYRPFSIGFRLDPFFYGRGYWLDDPYQYRLPPAYGPYRWVRYFDDVLLVDVNSGIVVDAINQFFW